MVWIRKKYNYN